MGSSTHRVVFVDLLRLLATFQMVQGHSIDAVLATGLRSGEVFGAWTWVRGLTSVAFLFAAGVSFHLSTLRRFEAHRASPKAIRRRVRRALLIVFIGYLLHNPFGALVTGAWGEALAHAAIVDVLQCIGVSLLILAGLALALPSARAVVIVSSVLGVMCVALWPLTESTTPAGATAFVTNYFTHRGGSIFPLLPWAGYLFAGVVAGAVSCPNGVLESSGLKRLFLLSVALLVVAVGLRYLWHGAANPQPGLLKLAVVSLGSTALAAVSIGEKRLPEWLTILAGETLVIYVVHVALLYGDGYGLADVIGPTLAPAASMAVAVGMVVSSAALGFGWRWAKERSRVLWPALARRVKAG
jgi:uncharacterized membrane protein